MSLLFAMASKALADAYAACAHITRREARNFYYAFASLPRRQRFAVYALYAFCREADDCVDSACSLDALSTMEKSAETALLLNGEPANRVPLMGAPSAWQNRGAVLPFADEEKIVTNEKRQGIGRLRERLAAAADGCALVPRDLALVDAIERFGVSPQDLADVISGVEMDLVRTRYQTFEELQDYCYHVASAVGLATLPILNAGVPPTDAMREYAVDLGLGMQLVNILRDVSEDLDRDRVYLPQEDLIRCNVDQAAFVRKCMTEPLRLLLAFEASRAAEYLDRGRQLLPYLPRRGRACPWLLAEIYGRVLRRIIDSDYDVFGPRVSLPAAEKLWLLATARWRTG